MLLNNVLLKGFFFYMEENGCHFNPHDSERSWFCILFSHAGNRLFLGWNYRTKDACQLCSTRGWGGSRQDAVTSGSSGKSRVKKGTRIERQVSLSFISNKDKRPSQPHQPLKEPHAKPPRDMGLGVGSLFRFPEGEIVLSILCLTGSLNVTLKCSVLPSWPSP